MKVVAALSGGVDSAVAAARLLDEGHEVVGVHLALSRNPLTFRTGARGCCSLEDSRDARRVADVLGIPFYVWDFADRFHDEVVVDFLDEYERGRTPNPCVRCNERIKFVAVLERALALGFDAVGTGHYAQVVEGDGSLELHRGTDPSKDQSYVLAVLSAEQLGHVAFPLGSSTKGEVRQEARSRGLLVADKPDSHDICFIADGDTAGFLRRRLGDRRGVVVDTDGRELAQHDGAWGVTVGQRHGLRLDRPAPDGAPRYVLGIEPVTRTVVVGPRDQLAVSRIQAAAAVWCGPALRDGTAVEVQWRAHGPALPGTVTSDQGGLRVDLGVPAEAVAPGQTLVLYRGTRVLGSATVVGTDREPLVTA